MSEKGVKYQVVSVLVTFEAPANEESFIFYLLLAGSTLNLYDIYQVPLRQELEEVKANPIECSLGNHGNFPERISRTEACFSS